MSASTHRDSTPNWGAGIGIGVALGVSLSVALDNWGYLALGAGLAVAFAMALGSPAEEPDDGEGSHGGAAEPPHD